MQQLTFIWSEDSDPPWPDLADRKVERLPEQALPVRLGLVHATDNAPPSVFIRIDPDGERSIMAQIPASMLCYVAREIVAIYPNILNGNQTLLRRDIIVKT